MKRYLIAALALAVALTGVQTWRLDRVKGQLTTARDAYAALDKQAKAERLVATTDAQTTANQCQARVDEARQSSRAIERIITREIHVDPQGCAVRSIVPAGELRDALQPSAHPQASAAQPLH